MSAKRPSLSNLTVCAVYQLNSKFPDVFDALGQDGADEAGKFSACDVLSVITGRDFDDCAVAIEKAEAAGLVEVNAASDGWLTSKGEALMTSMPLDLISVCRELDLDLSAAARNDLRLALSVIPEETVVSRTPTKNASFAAAAGFGVNDDDVGGVDLDDDTFGQLDDDGDVDVPGLRRPARP